MKINITMFTEDELIDLNHRIVERLRFLSQTRAHNKMLKFVEGHQLRAEKMDRIRDKMTGKIDAVATDLAAHRADTEGHKRGYMVKEP